MSLKQLTVFAWFAFVSITILATPAEGAKKPKYTNQDVKCHGKLNIWLSNKEVIELISVSIISTFIMV